MVASPHTEIIPCNHKTQQFDSIFIPSGIYPMDKKNCKRNLKPIFNI